MKHVANGHQLPASSIARTGMVQVAVIGPEMDSRAADELRAACSQACLAAAIFGLIEQPQVSPEAHQLSKSRFQPPSIQVTMLPSPGIHHYILPRGESACTLIVID